MARLTCDMVFVIEECVIVIFQNICCTLSEQKTLPGYLLLDMFKSSGRVYYPKRIRFHTAVIEVNDFLVLQSVQEKFVHEISAQHATEKSTVPIRILQQHKYHLYHIKILYYKSLGRDLENRRMFLKTYHFLTKQYFIAMDF